MNMKITSVEAKTHKLRCEYTREMATEINMYSGLDNFALDDYIRKTLRKESINNIFNK